VGGMKEAALKQSESKNIIIATYSMAAEALDIKSLTTLLMATPKTDVTQSIGRILRTKHSQPLVIDIVDSHEVFQKQWGKRKAYYKKQNYEMKKTTSLDYFKDKWTPIEYAKKGKKSGKKGNDDDNVNKNALLKGKCLI
jgi:superfamily II DNA or RNA helicase